MPWKGTISSSGDVYVVGRRVVFIEPDGGSGGEVGCLDARTGKLLWRRSKAGERADRLVAGSGHVLAKTERELQELDPRTGRVVWRTKIEPYHLGPYLAGELAIAETRKGLLVAYDLRTHRLVWSRDLGSELAGYTRNGVSACNGRSLWAHAADGTIVGIAAADGRLLVRKPFRGGSLSSIVPMGSSVALIGDSASEAWRAKDGETVWRRTDLGRGAGYHVATRDELWVFPYGEGDLYRLKGNDGTSIDPPQPIPEGRGLAGGPIPYGDGFVLGTEEGMVRLSASGRTTGRFEGDGGPMNVATLDSDLVLQYHDRIVRLRNGTAPLPANPGAVARRLLAKPRLDSTDLAALLRLGRAAIPPLLSALPKANGWNESRVLYVLRRVVDARDTAAVYATADGLGAFSKGIGEKKTALDDFLEEKANPDWLARRLLPRLRATSSPELRNRLIGFMLRSTDRQVVDELFARLRSPSSSDETRGLIYPSIARSARQEILSYVVDLRSQGRRLSKPIPELSSSNDTDRDGIADAYDANPYVAPRSLNETEKVLFAAFDAEYRWQKRYTPFQVIAYGPKVRPFELLGWTGGLRPVNDERRPNQPSVGFREGIYFEVRSRSGNVVQFEKNGTEAIVGIAHIMGGGNEVRLRKIRGEWFSISRKGTWVN